MNIEPSELSDAIRDILSEASRELKNRIKVEGETVAKECTKTLQQNSPVRAPESGERKGKKGGYRPGAYARSWMYIKNFNEITGNSDYIVYNDYHYRLTHLLENGHVNRDGTRSRKFVHIAPANNKACREYERRVEDAIREM